MLSLDDIGELLRTYSTFLAAVAFVLLVLWTARHLLLRQSLNLAHERRLPRQFVLLGLSVMGIVFVVLALPVPAATRNQLLTVLGLLGSGVIALSSTTLVANAMAGLMLGFMGSFRTGDFIRIGHHFGRVTMRRLLHTEIQTEDRELTTLPNLYLITNPVTVVRSSGTLVSVNLSLGYDVHHAKIESCLIEAAEAIRLEKPFVRVLELGNFSVTYRVSGFLADIKNLLTSQSDLSKSVLSTLHGHNIEILSPTFMNQRPVPADKRLIPAESVAIHPEHEKPVAEEIMFDKAEQAERIEEQRIRIKAQIELVKEKQENAKKEDRNQYGEEVDRLRKELAELDGPSPPDSSKAID
ncbi:mechanosensitive ion channel [soil metagenome]